MERTLWSYVQCFYRASSYRENLCAPAAEKLLEQYLLAPSDTMTYDCRKLFSRETRKPPHSTLHIAHRTSHIATNLEQPCIFFIYSEATTYTYIANRITHCSHGTHYPLCNGILSPLCSSHQSPRRTRYSL